jgi:ethanolamine utilization protein EutP (predicted NTPase)
VPSDQIILAIACTKSDLDSERVVSKSRAESFAKRVDAMLYETSAKDNIGVEEIFSKLSEEVGLY